MLKAAGLQTLYNTLYRPVGHACPNQHEHMLLLTHIVSTIMHGNSKLHAAVSQPSLGHMGPNFEG